MVDKKFDRATVVVIGSGPSLTAEDCKIVERSLAPTIAVNTSWKMARFADVIYAGDAKWWASYGDEIDTNAECWTCSKQAASRYKIKHHDMHGPYNSGQRAIQLAVQKGAKRVVLLGFDCSLEDGIHWHGPHPLTENPDFQKVRRWRAQFRLAKSMADNAGCEVLNASRKTSLECFPRVDLKQALGV